MSTVQDARPQNVSLTFSDGSTHDLKFTLNALALLEEKYGDVDTAFGKLDSGSFIAIRYMLWAALQHEAEPLTENQVGNLIDMNSLGSISEALGQAADNGLPTEQQNQQAAVAANVSVVPDPNK